jgi:hypothetical protein
MRASTSSRWNGLHEDRHGAPCAPPGFQHGDAIHLRQPDIQNDGVIRLDFAEVVSFLAVEGAIDDVASVA